MSVTAIVPSRNEPYLQQTIDSLLSSAEGEIEVIAILDGYWPNPPLKDDKRLKIIHRGAAQGMRAAINSGVAMARGDYILKADAHCLFDKGFDVILAANCEDNWVVVPRRYRLDVERFDVIEDGRPPIDYMSLSPDLHGKEWQRPDRADIEIDDLMSSQGSCWFMKKEYFHELELLDEETYGTFWSEFQEIGLKVWLSGGQVKVNKKTWYAHWHKTKVDGRGYTLPRDEKEKAAAAVAKWKDGTGWHKQVYPLNYLIEKFAPVPGWEGKA